MEGEDYHLRWEDNDIKPNLVVTEEVICGLEHVQNVSYSDMKAEEMIANSDHTIAAENLVYLSQDMSYMDSAELAVDPSVECVTEEVITDDWAIGGGQDRVEVPMEHLVHPVTDIKLENDLDVPLPTDQDEYTAMRPFPCDFCSRRFRKKAALMNHMVAHQNDRPHVCNLCGVRYVRKCDLMNHLKVHAFIPDDMDSMEYNNGELLQEDTLLKPRKKRGRRKKKETVENGVVEHMTSARTQQWSRRGRTPPAPPPVPPSPPTPSVSPSPPNSPQSAPPSPPPPPLDPTRPFVCRHCGVGFAREKALQSHARIHGGDSPIECNECGELCWSREALTSHTANKHPHLPGVRSRPVKHDPYDDNSGDDMDFRLSPMSHERDRDRERVRERPGYDTVKGPELFCEDCGVAFQRADLLRRHVAAAHSYKRHDSTSSTWAEQEHTCDVCGEACPDALQLLAHAERHAERHRGPAARLKKTSKTRNTSSANVGRQFPCRECGKVFGSRSSQQIHVRIHTGERPYACRFCWKAFADGGTLRKHERIHTGEKPYACAVCPRAFNQRVVLREHVRSHHSAPDRRTNGAYQYTCAVCGRTLPSSGELVQHLIRHCDENTAMKRMPLVGPRKYKRRRKIKNASPSPEREWKEERKSRSPTPPSRSPTPPAPSPPTPSTTVATRRRRRVPPPAKRPRMIHTSEETRARTKQVRSRRPPRHPADDLRVIAQTAPSPSPRYSPVRSPVPRSPGEQAAEGPFKCEMCSLEFSQRDALLLHVPIHI